MGTAFQSSKELTLLVQVTSSDDFLTIKVKEDAKFLKFREMIEKESKIPLGNQKIIHNNKVLELVNDEKLEKLGIKDNDMFLLEKVQSQSL